jgi:hypothetical protein
MKMKKVRIVSFVFVMSFILMGVAFATGWIDGVVANATVNTGKLEIQYGDFLITNDPGRSYDPGPLNWHAGRTEAVASGDKKEIQITVTNAYPGYNSTVTYGIKNTGSIPVKLGQPNVQYGSGTSADNVQIIASSPNGIILDPGATTYATITNTLTDNIAQTAQYAYNVTIPAVQFNK